MGAFEKVDITILNKNIPYGVTELSSLKISFLAGTLGQGGAERQLYYILRCLKENGTQVTLLCLSQGEFWEKPIQDLGIPIIWVGDKKNRITRLYSIFKEVKKNRPDIFQSQHFYTNAYVAIISRALGIRSIGGIRSNGDQDLRSVGFLDGYISLHLPSMLAVNSKNAIQYLTKQKKIKADKLKFLPNVVDMEKFRPPDKARIDNKPDFVRIISVGRLGQEKRYDRLLKLTSKLIMRLPDTDILLDIIGDGPKRNELEKMAVTMHLSGIVNFIGVIAEINSFYKKADIFILTSDWEGTPNVILEAMASGLPVVSTNVGGVSEIIKNGVTGFFYNLTDEENMLDNLVTLVKNPKLRNEVGRKAREYIEEYHASDRLANYLKELYNTNTQ